MIIVKNLLSTGNFQNFGGIMLNGGSEHTVLDSELDGFKSSQTLINALTLDTPTASVNGVSGADGVNELLGMGAVQNVLKDAFDDKSNYHARFTGRKYSVIGQGDKILDFTMTLPLVKFNGLEILNGELGDKVSLQVVHPIAGILDQFGFDYYVDANVVQKLPYVADIPAGLIVRMIYTNNGVDKDIYCNYFIHEVVS